MMTPSQLVEAMHREGYHVSERQLRDWREHGLLPALTTRGRGRGLGRMSYWEEPERILNQAIAVYEIMGKRERFDGAHCLEMWFAGYPINCDLARSAWLKLLSYIEWKFLHGASNPDGIDDSLAPLSARIGKKIALDSGLPDQDIQALAFEVLKTIFSPLVAFDIRDCWGLADIANAWLDQISSPRVGMSDITEEMLQIAISFIRANLSIKSMREVVSTATYTELENAHARWQRLHRIIGVLTSTSCNGELSTELSRTGRQLSVVFGCPCIFALLRLDRNGIGPMVDLGLNEAE